MNELLKALEGATSWKWRRLYVFVILFWAMGLITYIAIVGSDATRDGIAFNVTGLLITLTGTYIFGAAWEGKDARKSMIAASNKPDDRPEQ
jgi:hypothetical protein